MKINQFVPFRLSLSLLIGIIISYHNSINTLLLIGILITVLTGLFLLYYFNKTRKNKFFTLGSFLLFIFIGMLSMQIANPLNHKNHYSKQKSNKSNSYVLQLTKELKASKNNYKYTAKIVQVNNSFTTGKVLVNFSKKEFDSLQIDQTFLVVSSLLKIQRPKNINQFNYKEYLKKNGIFHQFYLTKEKVTKIENASNSVYGLAAKFRKKVIKSLQKNGFKKDELAIINALLLGQRQEMSKDLVQDYQKAGAVHILAVSGLHISVILAILIFLFKPLERFKKGKLISTILILIGLWAFAFIAGLSPSVVRAVTMFSAITIGLFLKKKTETIHSVFISMFVLLLIYPYYVFTVGFQLSYLAVISILVFYPFLSKFYMPKNKIVRGIWQIILVSFSAQIGVLPLSLYYFHQFPSLFFISSIVIIPFLGLLLGFGILVIALSLLHILPNWLANFYQLILEKMNAFIHFIANQEDFLITNISFSFYKMMASYVVLLMVIFFIYKQNRKNLIALICSILLIQGVFIFEKYQTQTTNELVVFNQYKNTIIAYKKGKNVNFYTSDSSITVEHSVIKNYLLSTSKSEVKINQYLPNIFPLTKKNLLIIDSLGIYQDNLFKSQIIVLRQSPKINVERLILENKPIQIIADASNFKSYIERWKTTCKKYKIPFYSTYEQGALKLQIK